MRDRDSVDCVLTRPTEMAAELGSAGLFVSGPADGDGSRGMAGEKEPGNAPDDVRVCPPVGWRRSVAGGVGFGVRAGCADN